jgi:hypothetical protein
MGAILNNYEKKLSVSSLIYLHVIHESRVFCTYHKAPVNQYAHAHCATRFRNEITMSAEAECLKTFIRTLGRL